MEEEVLPTVDVHREIIVVVVRPEEAVQEVTTVVDHQAHTVVEVVLQAGATAVVVHQEVTVVADLPVHIVEVAVHQEVAEVAEAAEGADKK